MLTDKIYVRFFTIPMLVLFMSIDLTLTTETIQSLAKTLKSFKSANIIFPNVYDRFELKPTLYLVL